MAAAPAAPVAPAVQDVATQAAATEVKEQVAEIKERVARIESQVSYLTTQDMATKADIAEVKEQVARIESQFPHIDNGLQEQIGRIEGQLSYFATKADLVDLTARLERALRLQTYWLVGTLLAVGGLILRQSSCCRRGGRCLS